MPDFTVCPYCSQKAQLVTGEQMYIHRRELWAKKFWRCDPCGAWVGCHPGTEIPLGRLADMRLRVAKSNAHAAFDKLWGDPVPVFASRKAAYVWLAGTLGLPLAECHIGWFDVATCLRVRQLSIVRWNAYLNALRSASL